MTTFANLACALFLTTALAAPAIAAGATPQRSDPRRNTDERRGRRSHERVGERCGQQTESVVGGHGRK